ncbi:mitochondrial ribosomal protein, putative [Babesia ovata]|uniref:Mitochondrial ribosomal protein, putative n=1 Tax=Babesia ovata TaxID=189622 RepID=A0A2H6KG22_9APIC|nr:mitochondrial ribosomal protein, putative [Babesia ovata]GBE61942.1 mitochondrial ribosomal protein, putative [Babesia ovata]
MPVLQRQLHTGCICYAPKQKGKKGAADTQRVTAAAADSAGDEHLFNIYAGIPEDHVMLPDEAYPSWLWQLDKPDKTYGELLQMFVYGKGIEDAQMRDYNRFRRLHNRHLIKLNNIRLQKARKFQIKGHLDSLVLVAHGEPSQLLARVEHLQADGRRDLEVGGDEGVVLHEGGVELLLLGGLVGGLEQLVELHLNDHTMGVHDAEVTRGDERPVLEQVDDLYHGNELGDHGARPVDVTDDGSLADLVLIKSHDAQPDVFTGFRVGELLLIEQYILHLHLDLLRHDNARLT